ncbi:HIRA-interacting protein 3 isoform X2 [Athene noctua]|uniref:HIRA-interacting protein 3 isoform X2 n=1 Tax=Athene noctua TaxID=126797 RepID=UPI003EBD9B26
MSRRMKTTCRCENGWKKGKNGSRRRRRRGRKGEAEGQRGGRKRSRRDAPREVSGRGGDPPALRRLKRYLRLCGVRPNYKKLLGGCGGLREKLGVLRGELQALGLTGPPSLARCRRLRRRREEAAELAALDVANILPSAGRSRRRNAWSPPKKNGASPPPPRPVDWSHLRGVISSDGESD